MSVNIRQLITQLNLEGESLFNAGQTAEAIAKFEEALAFDEENAETLNNLAVAHFHLGDCELALQCLTEALRVDPTHDEAFVNAWKIFSKLGRNRRARELYTAFMELHAARDADSGMVPDDGRLFLDDGAGDMKLIAASDNRVDSMTTRKVVHAPTHKPLKPLPDQPLVSVIIPTRNRAELLKDALESVAAQDYPNWEVCVVNDGGEDVSALVNSMDGAGRMHYRSHTESRRQGAAKNTALDMARGTVICYLDDDDRFLPQHLSTVVAALRESQAAFVYTDSRMVREVIKGGQRQVLFSDVPYAHGDFSKERLTVSNYIPINTWAHRRECIEELGSFDERLQVLEDWEFLLRLAARWDFVHVPQVTVEVRVRADQDDNVSSRERRQLVKVYEHIYRVYPAHDNESIAKARERTLADLRRQLDDAALSEATDTDSLYQAWVDKHHLSEEDGQFLAERMMTTWRARPHIELFVVLRAGEVGALSVTVRDLANQLYKNWRLTVVADHPHAANVGFPEQVRWIEERDDPLRCLNRMVTRTQNAWIGIIDAGDRFPPHATFAYADYINLYPKWRLIYTDEDVIDDFGIRSAPRFKPDFNLDLLRSVPYMGRFCLVRADALGEVGAVRVAHAGHAYDLALRILDRFGNASIGHISDVLYHRCAVQDEAMATPAMREFSRRAVAEHLDRQGVPAAVSEGFVPGTHHVQYEHAGDPPLVSIVVPTRDKLEYLKPCITSLLHQTEYPRFEVIIVDNGSREPATLEFLETIANQDGVRVLDYPEPFNFAAINNRAAREAQGEYLLLLNNDTQIVQPQWLDRMMSHGRRAEVGVVGARLVFPNQKVQHAGVVTGLQHIAEHVHIGLDMNEPGYMARAQCVQGFSAVTAACLLIRKSLYVEVGGMDGGLAVLFNDVDLCLKVGAAGYKVVWTPYATLLHHGSSSVGQKRSLSDRHRSQGEAYIMLERWLPKLARDPAYNSNLTLRESNFQPEVKVDVRWDTHFHDRPRVMAFPFNEWGSGEYRVRAPLRAMSHAGLVQHALMPTHKELRLPTICELERAKPDVILLHNTLHGEHLRHLSLYKRFNSAFRIFGEDDLLSELPDKNPYSKTVYKDIKARLRRALDHCDRLIVTTEPLAAEFTNLIDDIVVVPNRLEGSRWRGLHSLRRRGRKPRIGWAGAQQHQGDLELLIEVVEQTHREADWVFLGMCPEQIQPMCAEYHQGVSIDRYPAKLASLNLDLAVAPLEHNRFNEAKSNLRLLEYGILGWPVVCSDILPYRDAPVCRVANRAAAWVEAIRERIHDPDAAAWEGEQLKQWVLRGWILEDHLDQWLHALVPGWLHSMCFGLRATGNR